MIKNVIILTRKDLVKVSQDLPIEEVRAEHLALNGDPKTTLQDLHMSGLILFVDEGEGRERIKVLKNRRLGGRNAGARGVPTGTILPDDLFGDLVNGVLDLSSPRVVLP